MNQSTSVYHKSVRLQKTPVFYQFYLYSHINFTFYFLLIFTHSSMYSFLYFTDFIFLHHNFYLLSLHLLSLHDYNTYSQPSVFLLSLSMMILISHCIKHSYYVLLNLYINLCTITSVIHTLRFCHIIFTDFC